MKGYLEMPLYAILSSTKGGPTPPYCPACQLRYVFQTLLALPWTAEVRWVGGLQKNRTFSVVSPQLWNAFPLGAHLTPSLLGLRHHPKTFITEGFYLFKLFYDVLLA